jgi:hypothetical protein
VYQPPLRLAWHLVFGVVCCIAPDTSFFDPKTNALDNINCNSLYTGTIGKAATDTVSSATMSCC